MMQSNCSLLVHNIYLSDCAVTYIFSNVFSHPRPPVAHFDRAVGFVEATMTTNGTAMELSHDSITGTIFYHSNTIHEARHGLVQNIIWKGDVHE